MPVIYGSSIKGVLRSAFVNDPDYIQSLLDEIIEDKTIEVKDLIKDIFDGQERDPENDDPIKGTIAYKNKSIYKRDIFFDAVIMELTKRKRNSIVHPDAIFIKLIGTGSLRGFLWGVI